MFVVVGVWMLGSEEKVKDDTEACCLAGPETGSYNGQGRRSQLHPSAPAHDVTDNACLFAGVDSVSSNELGSFLQDTASTFATQESLLY